MKRGFIIFTVFLVCLLGVLIIVPGFIDWNRHKDTIITQLENATGHDYEINGALEFTVLPFPKLLIEDFSVSNDQNKLASLKRLDVQVELMPLVQGNIVVNSVTMVEPDIALEFDREGNTPWLTDTLNAKLASKDGKSAGQKNVSDLVSLNSVNIKNGRFLFSDAGTGRKEEIGDVNLSINPDSLAGPFNVEGDLGYKGQTISFTANTGRYESAADTISVRADIDMPDLDTNISYSGVVGTKGGIDIQGETGFQSDNVSKVLMAFTGKGNPYLAKSFETKGVLSVSENKLDYRNLKMDVSGNVFAGHVSLDNLKTQNPVAFDVNLSASEPVKLDAFIPASEKASGKAQGFLPETMFLPLPLSGQANVTLAGASYKGQNFKNVNLSVTQTEKAVKADVKADMNGGRTEHKIEMSFGSSSRSEGSGGVTLSDPQLAFDSYVETSAPVSFLTLFVEQEQLESAQPYLQKGLTFSANGVVTPSAAKVTGGTARLNETALAFGGGFVKSSSKRDQLSISLESERINLDQWMSTPKQGADKLNIEEYTKRLDLPFDLSVTAVVKAIEFGGEAYKNMQLKAAVAGKSLKIDRASIEEGDGNSLTVAGTIGDVVALKDVNLSITGQTRDLETVMKSFSLDTSRLPARVGAAEIASEFRGQPDNLAFTVNLKALKGSLEASGQLANMLKTPSVSGVTLRLRHPSYVELARLFSPSFKSGVNLKKNLDLFASMKNEDGIYSFSEIKALVGPATLSGDLRVDTSGAKPVLKARLQTDNLPLDDFLGHDSSVKGTTRVTPQRAKTETRWSRDAIDMAWLNNFDLDLQASAASLTYGSWTIKNAKLDSLLNGGLLKLQNLSGEMYQGKVLVEGSVKASVKPREPLSVTGKVVAENIQLEPFVQSFSGSKLVKARGPISVDLNFQTTGLSQAALVFDLQGKGTATGSNLTFKGFDLARLSRALAEPTSSFSQNFGRVLDATTSGGTTNFDTLDSAFDIKDGVILFSKLDLVGPQANVIGEGNINLPLWTVDLTTNVKLHEPEDAPVLKTVFKGPLDSPAKTFGQNALNQYFRKQLGGLVVNPLLEKLQDKGILPGQPQKQAPQTNGETEIIQPEPQTQGQPEAQTQGQQVAPSEQPKEKRPITKEEAIFGVIEGLLGGQ